MLVIRLTRTGRKKYPTYRIVAADSKRAATGKFVMVLGNYNPHTKELVIKKEETVQYLKNGAQPSNAVIKLLKQQKIDVPDWAELKTRNRAPKKEVEVKEPAAPAAEAEPTVAPAEEDKATEAPAEITETAAAEVEAVADNAPSDTTAETATDVEAETAAAEASASVDADSETSQ